MSTTDEIGQEGAVGVQADEQFEAAVVDEVAEREQRLAPSVEQSVQATVDYADERAHKGRLFGQTLEAEERLAAFEWEVERTRTRWDRGQDSDREVRCRSAVGRHSRERRFAFEQRAASVEPWADPERPDARAQLSGAELGAVNREAGRLADRLDGFSRAAVSRLVAERVVDGHDVNDAVLAVYEALRVAPGQRVPIGLVGEAGQSEVDIEGVVSVLWEPSHPSIAQVGLLADESGRIKFTVWKESRQPTVREGERVRFRNVATSWYQGRPAVAVTGWSRVVFPE